ncbi:MAG: hypothetical protein HEP71_23350 [Roseivirga sp.]|nr:hypothetical protein [Roseivirga sp.]
MKRLLLFLSIALFIGTSMSAQFYNPEATEQMKRTIRKNNHIQKTMNGQIVKNLFKGRSKSLYGFIFKSDRDEYYHVSLKGWEGKKIMPYLKINDPMTLTVSGDPVLLEEVMHYKNEYLRIENTMDIRLKGLAHFEALKSTTGAYNKNTSGGRLTMTRQPDKFHESVAILSKKKVPGNAWAYALENKDTIIVRYEDDDQLKGKKRLTYFTSESPLVNGGYFKAPNTYNFLGKAPYDPEKESISDWMMAGRSANILEKDRFKVLGSNLDSRGLLNGFKVKNGTLYFNARNGESMLNALKKNQSFEGYYKKAGDNAMMLYAIKNNDGWAFYDNSDVPFTTKNHYEPNKVTFTGDITETHLKEGPQSAKLKSFIVNDSIYVSVNEVVALNIQKMIKEGKKVSITGWIRKEVPGEVNEQGLSIMAMSEIVINGKTFNQTIHDLTKVL